MSDSGKPRASGDDPRSASDIADEDEVNPARAGMIPAKRRSPA